MRTRRVHVALAACTLASGACADRPNDPIVVVHGDPAGTVDVAVSPAVAGDLEASSRSMDEWQRLLAVYTGEAPAADDPAVIGSYTVDDDRLRFVPRFPPVPGQAYTVRIAAGALGWPGQPADAVLDTIVRTAAGDRTPSTRVTATFPSADTVPQNLLRLYVWFSAPMSIGEAERRVLLLDEDDAIVEDAFLLVPQELWDPDRTRLTVLFDPGRIKRDLRPSEELGLPLRTGRRYTLVIDSAWHDGRGVPLAAGYRRSFTVAGPDRALPRPDDWTLEVPGADTRDPFVVRFPEPMDHGLLGSTLAILRADGTLAGTAAPGPGERTWAFTPDRPWSPGQHTLRIDTDLEDLAGNNLRQVFDIDPSAPDQRTGLGGQVDLPFIVR